MTTAITPGTINSDTIYGQAFRRGGQIMVIPFTTAVDAVSTWQAPANMNPVAVAWQPATTAEIVAVTLSATTKVVRFDSDGLSSYSGNLVLVLGGAS